MRRKKIYRGQPHTPLRDYTYGATGTTRPETYSLDGAEHRFDGTCHPDCPDVR